jgi:hypothetical protein
MSDLDKLHVAKGLTMPFIPMVPRLGPPIRTKAQIRAAVNELDDERWVVQPELGGTRVCLAIVDKKVYIQDAHGIWLSQAPHNVRDFLKLPNGTCLDGKVAHGNFYPFECLAIRGYALVFRPVAERATVAYQLVKLLKHQWMFQRPTPKFIAAARKNLPDFQGVTLKDYMSFYVMVSKQNQPAQTWLKHSW